VFLSELRRLPARPAPHLTRTLNSSAEIHPHGPPAACGTLLENKKWSASSGITGKNPILGFNPADADACCAQCQESSICESYTFFDAVVGTNKCYLFKAGATITSTSPLNGIYYSAKGKCPARI
jgi:hypothetical protein